MGMFELYEDVEEPTSAEWNEAMDADHPQFLRVAARQQQYEKAYGVAGRLETVADLFERQASRISKLKADLDALRAIVDQKDVAITEMADRVRTVACRLNRSECRNSAKLMMISASLNDAFMLDVDQ